MTLIRERIVMFSVDFKYFYIELYGMDFEDKVQEIRTLSREIITTRDGISNVKYNIPKGETKTHLLSDFSKSEQGILKREFVLEKKIELTKSEYEKIKNLSSLFDTSYNELKQKK